MTTPRHSDMFIKICGNKDPQNIRNVAHLTPMMMGFIFYDGSPRDASGLDPEVVASLPAFVRPVAVFVNAPEERILEVCNRFGIKIVQLHSDESPEFCQALRDRGLTVFKSAPVGTDTDWEEFAPYVGHADLLLLDNKSAKRGGSGQKFDWAKLASYSLEIPFVLGGGIGPDDVDNIVANMHPGMAGIDINSRFETEPGIKDLNKLIKFIVKLRSYNEDEPTPTPFWEKAK